MKYAMRERDQADYWLCATCGHENLPEHQFCGMCGTQVPGSAAESLGVTEDIYSVPGAHSESNEHFPEAELGAGYEQPIDEEDPLAGRDPYDLSLFQSLRGKEVRAEYEYEHSSSGGYRYSVGLILTILILGLGYMAWRATQTNQNAQSAPPPPPPAAIDTVPPPVNSPPMASKASAPAPPVELQPPGKDTGEASVPKAAEPLKPANPSNPANAVATRKHAAAPPTPATENAGPQTDQGNGDEELAMAQRYLTSRPRYSAEAARWLWKAMAKHNGPASVALADLYLKGDGVSKNCDQARLLLDSAAQRGVTGAGERLRHLRAFGCQ